MHTPIILSIILLIQFFIIIKSFQSNSISIRNERFFSLWGVGLVRFENGVCKGADGLYGTCFTRRQCKLENGTSSGICANGIAVCCILQVTCNGVTSTNNTYFVSPHYPKPFNQGATCSITIQKYSNDICQIRLDFLTFSFAQPNGNGSCLIDTFFIIGGAAPVPLLCGENSGQHMYIDFNGNIDIQLIINTQLTRPWNIKITQIECDSSSKAPTGCLQYFTSTTGTIKSFNYGSTGNQIGTRQLINENYGVCIKMLAGYCTINWQQSIGDPYSFTVSNNTYLSVNNRQIGTPEASLKGSNCTTDFIVIPNPVYTNGTPVNTDRFCGNGFPPIKTSSKPFVMTVYNNGDDSDDVGNRGFSLYYTQEKCIGGTILG